MERNYETKKIEIGKIKSWLWHRTTETGHKQQLANSIKNIGMQQLPILRPHPKHKGFYEGICGEQRITSLLENGGKPTDKIEVRFRPDISDIEALHISWDTNILKSPSRVEKAEFLNQCLQTETVKNQAHLSKILGITESTIAEYLPLARNPVLKEIAEKYPERQINREIQRVILATPEKRQKKVAKNLMESTDPEAIVKARETENRIAYLNDKRKSIENKLKEYELRLREHEKKAKSYPGLKKKKEQLSKQLKLVTNKINKSGVKEHKELKIMVMDVADNYFPLKDRLKEEERIINKMQKNLDNITVDVDLYQKISDKISDYEKKIGNVNLEIEKLKAKKTGLEKQLSKLKLDNKKLEDDFKEKQDVENRIKKQQENIDKIKDKIAKYEHDYPHTIKNFEDEKKRLEKLDKHFSTLFDQKINLENEYTAVMNDFNCSKKSPKEVENLNEKIKTSNGDIAEIENEIGGLTKDL